MATLESAKYDNISDMVQEKITIYEPDRALNVGFFALWREMHLDLMKSRELVWRLFLRAFQAKYKQSLLGIAWVVINPLITVTIFVYLNSAGILNIGPTGVPYAVFAVVSLTIWNLFATGISAGASSIVDAGALVTKISFPKISLVLASLGQSIVDFGVRMILCAIIFLVFQITPAWTSIFLPIAVIPLMLFITGITFILSLIVALFRDITHVVPLATNFLMFVTPIIYPAPKDGLAMRLNAVNPLAHLITGIRDLVLYGGFSNSIGFIWSSMFALFIFLAAWRLFHITEKRIAERI